jgi:hypothetical protein
MAQSQLTTTKWPASCPGNRRRSRGALTEEEICGTASCRPQRHLPRIIQLLAQESHETGHIELVTQLRRSKWVDVEGLGALGAELR